MKRKRNNLDTAESNFLYAQVLVELNKNEKFKNLSILERNNLIDEVCLKCIDIANKNNTDKEALKFEIKSYKLSDEEKKKFYSDEVYENNLAKPEDFNDKMKIKYAEIIKNTIKEFA
jgi:hypothetical protein